MKFLRIAALLMCLGIILGGCADPGSNPDPGNVPGTGEVSTDGTTTSGTTEGTTTQTTENNTITLNTDLFDEYMMTYAELSEKHGKLVDFAIFDGGIGFYKFENGYGYYLFYTSYYTNNMETHPEGGFEYIPCNEDAVCRGIRPILPENLFNEKFETLSIDVISTIEGLTHIKTVTESIVTPRGYVSVFTYDGWNNDKIKFYIYHEDKDMIDLTSEARFYIHPDYVEEHESRYS